MKKVISILTLSIASVVGVTISSASSNTYALSYSDNIGVNFTFDQSLTVSLSSADIVINNLAPGSASGSNVIDVNVISNSLSGYTLTSTVGDNTHTNPSYDNTNLTHTSSISDTSSENVPAFTSLSTSDSISSLDDFNDNTWGYSYSLDNNTWSNYSGLPKYNDTTNVATLRTSTGPSSETGDDTYFKIAAKASTTQPSGEYRNVINFTVTAEHNPMSLYDSYTSAGKTMHNGYYTMQDMTPSICNNVEIEESQLQAIDIRDNSVYTIAKLKDNRCWMTTNLGFSGNILDSTTSNVSAQYTPSSPLMMEWYDLKTDGGRGEECWGSEASGDGLIYECKHAPNSTYDSAALALYSEKQIGVWYNYAGATAGTIAGEENATDATYDICPLGWRLPNGNQTTGEIYELVNVLSANVAAFSPFYGGAYWGGGLYVVEREAFWWSSGIVTTDRPEIRRPVMKYTKNGLSLAGNNRHDGVFIRCIANSQQG